MGNAVAPEAPPPDTRGERLRSAVRVFGEVLITLGVVVLLFVFYEVYVTSWFSARKQAEATDRLESRWSRPGGEASANPIPGRGFARLHIPALGPEFPYTVLEGTDQETLAVGPGHYVGTAMPGERGNFAVAGHRTGRGAPFGDLDQLESCDALVVETSTDWYVYRVLPLRNEVSGWNGHGGSPECAGVAPIGGPYDEAVGKRIVEPENGEVTFPVPGKVNAGVPVPWRSRLITLTTCHPRYSADERLIVHGVLTKRYPKEPSRPDLRPPELRSATPGPDERGAR